MSNFPGVLLHPESKLDDPTRLTDKLKRKWHYAFYSITCLRVFLSLFNQITESKCISSSCPPNVDQTVLTRLVSDKDIALLKQLGGVEKVALQLNSHKEHGIPRDDAEDIPNRIKEYGSNVYNKAGSVKYSHFVWEASKDRTILILFFCAALYLGFDIKENGLKEESCINGGTILFAIFTMISLSALTNYKQSRPLLRDNIQTEAWRGSMREKIPVSETVVGDVILLKIGDGVPADGVLVEGHSLQADESSMTGIDSPVEISSHQNPFLFSGTKITHGYGRMLVTSVGMNTTWGERMSQKWQGTSEKTPLQERLEKLYLLTGKAALGVAFLLLVVLSVRYFTGNTKDANVNKEYNSRNARADDIIRAVIGTVAAAITIVVMAIPEGLHLALTCSVAYSMNIMMTGKALVLKSSACETMGSVTTICTDKTGTLTMNQMEVTKIWLGKDYLEESSSSTLSSSVVNLIRQGVALNTTGSVHKQRFDSEIQIAGSPTEKAIISWALSKLQMDMKEARESCRILHVEAFNSQNNRSGVLINRKVDNTTHVHWTGAAEMILGMCSSFYTSSGDIEAMDEEEKHKFKGIIESMAASRLRCIAFAHKQVPAGEEHKNVLKEDELTLLGLIGLKDPCRPEAKEAVQDCQHAGVSVKMITGDNIFTAKAIATECGILLPHEPVDNGVVILGEEFRNYNHEDRMKKLKNIRVVARASADDKLLMVQCLKQSGEVVAVTGDGANDARALVEADVGLSMGIQGTEVAKESSDIIIMDDNFASVVRVLRCGRCVYHNNQKLVQFQLTANVSGLLINFAAAAASREVPFTIVRSLWLNTIMDTLLALALTKDKATPELMLKPPVGRTEPFITNIMCRNLLAQALYQTIVLLILQFKGEEMFGVNDKVNGTLIFNTYVLCQMFNEFNARKLEKRDIFRNIHTDKLFLGIIAVASILQVVTVELLSKFQGTERLNYRQWGACLATAVISWPIGWVVKCIPVQQNPIFHYMKMKMN